LIVVGASAGGIGAILTLVASLPSDFPAPVIVAQHLDPNRRSQLGELLASRSKLPVRTASGNDSLEPGMIYVVPSDRDVEISDHHIGLRRDGVGLSRPSVDRLMSTAARVFGETLTGVILTGMGEDGSAGTQAIKAYGGTVIVQNPESAEYAGMPASVPASAIDIVADLEAIGPLLVDLYSGIYALPPPDEDAELRSFLGHVREQSGLDFSTYKRPTIQRRLMRRMVAVGSTSLAEYRRYVEQHPEELQRLVTSFLIKVTRFFRDPDVFDSLRDHILPSLIREARERGELRLWSAGCATGEEAYTLAMLVTDLIGDSVDPLPVRIFATDIATDAVEFARQGVYPASAVADLPADVLGRHFVHRDGVYEIRKQVRSLTVFGEHDLSQRAPFPRIDLVLCRNVLIYFAPELQRRSLQLFAFSLRHNGYLVLGQAETVSPLPEFFTLEQPGLKFYRRIGGSAPIPVDRVAGLPTTKRLEPRWTRSSRRGSQLMTRSQPARVEVPSFQLARTLDVLSTGVAVIDRDYHIITINQAARRLLGILLAGPGEDVIHRALPVLSLPLRSALDAAFRGETTTTIHRIPRDVIEESGRDLAITCRPAPVGDDEPITAAVLEVLDVTALSQQQRDVTLELEEVKAERDTLRERVAIATSEVRELRLADQFMAAELGRLRAENEQLQVAAEEAQAAAEEIETLNEEQQASNEELETLNEELQATVEELNTTNSDLQARTFELETLTSSLQAQRETSEAQRARLEAILTSMREAVQVIDESGDVLLVNPTWERLFGVDGDLVPEDELGRPLPASAWPKRRALERNASTLEFTLPGPDGGRRWFEASTQPVQTGDGNRWGVIVIRDITDRSLRHLQQQFLALASHELRTPLTTLSGSLQLLSRRFKGLQGEDRLQRHVARAWEQVRRLEDHIGELTDVVHLQSGTFRVEREPLDLTGLVRDALELAQYVSEGQAVRDDLPKEPIRVDGDARRLEQVLMNLMVNAFRHAHGSGGVDVRLRSEGDVAVIEVQDYGPGIPEHALPQIFSRFYQTEADRHARSGLGLGLFIAREIVAAHGGTIDVRSIEGDGATFLVRLPLLHDPDSHSVDMRHSRGRPEEGDG
jgi:two-component system CheB/CheR fusion protein